MSDRCHNVAVGRTARAFTLIEVMIVVVVLGIAASLSVPLINGWAGATPAAAARSLVSDLLFAQNLAITSRSTVYVAFGRDSYTICTIGGTAVTNPVTGQPYVVTVGTGGIGAMAGVSIGSLTLDNPVNTVLAFDDLGEPRVGTSTATATPPPLAANGSLVLTAGTVPVTIWVEPGTGNLTVSE